MRRRDAQTPDSPAERYLLFSLQLSQRVLKQKPAFVNDSNVTGDLFDLTQ